MFGSDGAGVLQIPEIYKTDAIASSWGCPKTKLRREDEQRDIPKGVYVKYRKVRCLCKCANERYLYTFEEQCRNTVLALYLRTGGLCVVPVRRSGSPTGIPFGDLADICSGYLSGTPDVIDMV
ncbi:hypothetical protein Tco_0833015 [Tanacetum coccineum]